MFYLYLIKFIDKNDLSQLVIAATVINKNTESVSNVFINSVPCQVTIFSCNDRALKDKLIKKSNLHLNLQNHDSRP